MKTKIIVIFFVVYFLAFWMWPTTTSWDGMDRRIYYDVISYKAFIFSHRKACTVCGKRTDGVSGPCEYCGNSYTDFIGKWVEDKILWNPLSWNKGHWITVNFEGAK